MNRKSFLKSLGIAAVAGPAIAKAAIAKTDQKPEPKAATEPSLMLPSNVCLSNTKRLEESMG